MAMGVSADKVNKHNDSSSRRSSYANEEKTKPLFFQPKLTVGPVDDPYEREADAVADKIMRSSDDKVSSSDIQPIVIQRKCAACDDDDKLQRQDDGKGDDQQEAPTIVGDALGDSGNPLDDKSRSFMEKRFGYDFSSVRIHTDSVATKSAQSINALAYTNKNNIVFNEGQYSPGTESGKKLLAHELTHVVQQNGGVSGIQRSPATDALVGALDDVLLPQRIISKGVVTMLELLPADKRDAAIKTILSKSISALQVIREPPEILKDAISKMTPGLSPTTIWPVFVSGLIGFYRHLDTLSGDELFSLFKKVVEAQGSAMFYIGGVEGVVEGVGKWFKDIFDLIVMLAEIGSSMAVPPLFIYKYSDEIKKAWEAASVAAKWISDNKEALLALLNDKEALMALQSVAKDLIYTAAEGAGTQIAEEIIKTINQGPYAMGNAGGKIAGYLLPDIILAIGTDGISGVVKGVQGAFKTLKAATLTLEEALLAVKAIEKIADGVKAMKVFGKGSKLGELGTKFIELLEQLIKVYKGFRQSHDDIIKRIIEIATKKGMPLDAAADNMFHIKNLETGLLNADFLKSKNFKEAIKILLDESHGDWKKVYQSITYAAQKGRFVEYDIIFDAMVKGKSLTIPRGFQSAEQFAEFSKEIGGILRRFGNDIKIQGSSTMELTSKLKDIDIAIFANETEFIDAMKKVWGTQFSDYYKLGGAPAAIDTKTFLKFLTEAEKVGKGNIAPNGVKITGEMESAWLARKNGKIFGSKMLTNAEKKIRDAWVVKLKLDKIDISLIMRGKAFDVGPFIPLK